MSKKEKVTETPEQEKKVVTRYDRRMQRRKEQEAKLQREHKITLAVSIAILVAVVALIASFPIRTFIGVNQEFVKIGDEKVTKVEFDYYYYSAINTYYNQYGAYLSYMGLDLSSDLSQQMYSSTLTWEDYFQKSAVQSIRTNKSVKKEAKAEGFAYDTSEEFGTFQEGIREQAAESGVSVDNYLKSIYGSYATMGRIEPYVKDGLYLNAYLGHVEEEKTPAEEDILAYYEENKDSYDSVDYRVVQIDAELPTEPTELADPQPEETEGTEEAEGEDAEEEAYQPSEAEIEAAMAAAKEKADEAEKTIETDAELTENASRASLNYNYSSWLFDAERTEGETTVIEDSTYHAYYVVQFVKRYRNDAPTVSFRAVVTDETAGDVILNEWTSGAATEESFIELVHKYSADTGAEDGLYEGIAEDDLNENLSAWLYAQERKAGDTTVVDSEDGTVHYVLYYVGEAQPEWYYSIENVLLEDAMNEYLDEVIVGCEVEDRKGNLNYLAVEASASAQASLDAENQTETGSESEDAGEGSENSTEASDNTEAADDLDDTEDIVIGE